MTGLYYGKALVDLRRYISTEIQRIQEKHTDQQNLPLYEGIKAVLEIEDIKGQKLELFSSLKKICDYVQGIPKDSEGSFSSFLPLFHSRYFHQLVKQALYQYWRLDAPVDELENRKGLDGAEGIERNLQYYKYQLSAYPKENEDYQEIVKDTQRNIQIMKICHYFETRLNAGEDSKQAPEKCREKAYYILDWTYGMLGNIHTALKLNGLLQAGLYFQRASLSEQKPILQMADEAMALQLYHMVIDECAHLTPDADLYAYSHILKYLSRFRFQHGDLSERIDAMRRHLLELIDIFPFLPPLQSNLSYSASSRQIIVFSRASLHALIEQLEILPQQEQPGQKDPKDQKEQKEKKAAQKAPFDHSITRVLYQAYEACIKNWYEEQEDTKQEERFRQRLIDELLKKNHWTPQDLQAHLSPPRVMVGRDEKGWMMPSRSLPFPQNGLAKPYQALEGVEVNYDTGDIHFLWKEWKEGDSPSSQLVTLLDLFEILRKNLQWAFFSLDPVDPTMPYHPFNQMRFEPSVLEGTPLLHTLFLTDYLLKFFTTHQEVQGKPPYAMRSLEPLTKHVPAYLMKIIHDFRQHAKPTGEAHRFWIETEELEEAESTHKELNQSGKGKWALSSMKMVVKKHLLERNAEGQLVDAPEAHEGWGLYVLTDMQRRAVKAKSRVINSPAMIFAEGTRDVYFWVGEETSEVFHVQHYDHLLPLFYHQTRDETERVVPTSKNQWRLYRLTREVAKQADRPHYFSAEYCFAQEFTAHYNEFALYFPELGRLRELSRMTVLVRLLNSIREANQEMLQKAKAHLQEMMPKIEQQEKKIQAAIQKMRKGYQEDYQEAYEKVRGQLVSDFEKWRQQKK